MVPSSLLSLSPPTHYCSAGIPPIYEITRATRVTDIEIMQFNLALLSFPTHYH